MTSEDYLNYVQALKAWYEIIEIRKNYVGDAEKRERSRMIEQLKQKISQGLD